MIEVSVAEGERSVVIRVPGKYSPDVLDDVVNRALDMLAGVELAKEDLLDEYETSDTEEGA